MRREHPSWYLLQCALGPRMLALRQLLQNIGGLVHPPALTAGLWPNLLERLPEPECTVGNRELGTDRKPPSSQIEEHFLPGLRSRGHRRLDRRTPFCLPASRRR